jgi:hypothetical protein
MVADYAGLPGVIFNFLLRFEDKIGRIIREELEPVFVDEEVKVRPELGRRFFLGADVPHTEVHRETLGRIRAEIAHLKHEAESFIRLQYKDYYRGAEAKRDKDIAILVEDLERFDQGIRQQLEERLRHVGQARLAFAEDSSAKGQRTRLENQLKMHAHRMQERREEIDRMRLGAFPAPELLNMVVVTPA